jgi:hypothetical protein
LDSRKDRIDNIFMKGLKLLSKNSGDLKDRSPLQMRTIAYREDAPWSRNIYHMGTRLSTPSDDNCNISRNLLGTLGLR